MALAEVAELKTPAKSWVPAKKQLFINGKWLEHMNNGTVLKILGTLAQHFRHGENVLLNPERKFVYFFRKSDGLLTLC